MLGQEGSKARPSYTGAHCGRPPVSTPTRPPSHTPRGEKANLARGARTDLPNEQTSFLSFIELPHAGLTRLRFVSFTKPSVEPCPSVAGGSSLASVCASKTGYASRLGSDTGAESDWLHVSPVRLSLG